MRRWSVQAWMAVAGVLALGGCNADHHESAPEALEKTTEPRVPDSSEAETRIQELRQRFQSRRSARPEELDRASAGEATLVPVIGASVGATFSPLDPEHVGAQIPPEAKRGVMHTASVALPLHGSGIARLEDDTSHLHVSFALVGASADSSIAVTNGMAFYPGALGGADVVHRVHAEGTEDFVVFEKKPARDEIAYDVDVSGVSGLRFIANTLEFMDANGSPRLRVRPPYVVDSAGERSEAKLQVDGCTYDQSPKAPWGRAVTKPGASHCTVRVAWENVAYPAMVDPEWTTTGALTIGHTGATANVLASGDVLVAGGYGGSVTTTAELYDPVAGTFAITGSMMTARSFHTSSLLGNTVLVTGGNTIVSGYGPLASAEVYDPGTGLFTATTGPMMTARFGHTASVLGSGEVLIAGGKSAAYVNTAKAELYNPVSGTFTPTNSMTTARDTQTANVLASGKVLIAGGFNYATGNNVPQSTAELYDPAAGTFTATKGPMQTTRASHTATALPSGLILFAGGESGINGATTGTTAELYNPTANTFALTGSMAVLRYGHTATLLTTGKVLVAGSATGCELFDPANGTFAVAAQLNFGRQYATASLLASSGDVLVAGGSSLTAELYDDNATGCMADADFCDANSYCAANGTCQPRKTTGAACNIAVDCKVNGCRECSSGSVGNSNCIGNVCVECTSDANFCSASSYCGPDYACHPRLALGAACNLQTDCKQSGFCRECSGTGNGNCVSGVCCNSACNGGPCEACTAALAATTDGTCGIAKVGENLGTCKAPQACNGTATTCPSGCTSDNDCALTDYCSAAGAGTCLARKAQAQVCDDGIGFDCKVGGCRVCSTGNCVDGYCCNSSCGPCGSCSSPTAGTCTVKAADQPPTPLGVCKLYLCDGVDGSCPTTCATSADCVAGDFCLEGACVTKLPQGNPCDDNSECQLGFCSDGVCCDEPCSGTCMACSAANKQTQAGSGTCGVAKAGTNPGNQCVVDANNKCGTVASCQGIAAACANAPSGQSCGATTCDTGNVSGQVCNGQGLCQAITNQACSPYICQNGACTSPCASDSQCVTGDYCSSGVCITKDLNGKACSSASQCTNGFCVDGVCCDSPCTGECQACGESDSLGICKTIMGPPRMPRPACTGAGSKCQGICDGENATACTYPNMATSCGLGASCAGDVSQPAGACDGSGMCTMPTTKPCLPYSCDNGSGLCKTICVSDVDCTEGITCDTSTGKCTGGTSTCSDTFTVKTSDGTLVPCSPYQCLNGACQQQCVMPTDCAPGYACSATSKCVKQAGAGGASASSGAASGSAASANATGAGGAGGAATNAASPQAPDDTGGCGCRTAGSSESENQTAFGAMGFAFAAMVFARRRNRLLGKH